MRRRIIPDRWYALTAGALLCVSTTTHAGFDVYFGEDSVGGNPAASRPNSDAAQVDFLNQLTGVGTEDFESFPPHPTTTVPFNVNFGPDTATLSGSLVFLLGAPTGGLLFGTSGDNFIGVNGAGSFSISFSSPQGAFGFYGTDIGDFAGQLVLTLTNGSTVDIDVPHTVSGPNGQVLYFGIVAQTVSDIFTSVTFSNSGGTGDAFGFDDLTIGRVEQISGINPGPEFQALLNRQMGTLRTVGQLHMTNLGVRLEDRRQGRDATVMLADLNQPFMIGSTRHAIAMLNQTVTSDASAPLYGDDEPIAAAFEDNRAVSSFASARLVFGDQSFGTSDEPFFVAGGTLGVDVKLTPDLIVGIAAGGSGVDAGLLLSGEMRTRGASGAVYATWVPEDAGLYVDAMAAYTYLDIEQDRVLDTGGTLATARSDFPGHQLSASARVGRDWANGPWNYGVFVQADYIHTRLDGYTESGAGLFDLVVEKQNADSLKSRLGVQVSKRIERDGLVIVPQMRAAWVHEYLDDTRLVNTQFVGIPGIDFGVNAAGGDTDAVELGAGVMCAVSNDLTLFADYQTELANNDRESHQLTFGVRFDF